MSTPANAETHTFAYIRALLSAALESASMHDGGSTSLPPGLEQQLRAMAQQSVPPTRTALRRRGPRMAQFVTEAIPSRSSSDVLIRVRAVPLGHKDLAVLDGKTPWPVLPNVVLGSGAAGEVVWVGEKVSQFKAGNRVVAIHDLNKVTGRETTPRIPSQASDGTLATYMVFSEVELVKIPDNLTWAEACIVPWAGAIAWSVLNMKTNNLCGKTVLVRAFGAVSFMALLLAVKAGATVIAISSFERDLEVAKKIGATHLINCANNPNWDSEVYKLTGLGVDIVVEQDDGESLLRSVNSLKREGRIAQVSFVPEGKCIDLYKLLDLLIIKQCTIAGVEIGSKGDVQDLMEFLGQTHLKLDSCIDRVFGFDQVMAAFDYIRADGVIGKLVIEF